MLQCNAPPSNGLLQEAAVQTAASWLNTAGFQLQQQELMLSTPQPKHASSVGGTKEEEDQAASLCPP